MGHSDGKTPPTFGAGTPRRSISYHPSLYLHTKVQKGIGMEYDMDHMAMG